ncbi:MAG: hypothetical protein JW860_10125 [Sedimentisphaerales bacterium]|nr:hypothetical protein [Sedimentisphaerales bacterium]
MTDLKNIKLIYLKGFLFVLGGVLASGMVILECLSWKVALLHGLAVWCFCRSYYFAFYVIEHYVDGRYQFAGLGSFLRYLWGRRKQGE